MQNRSFTSRGPQILTGHCRAITTIGEPLPPP